MGTGSFLEKARVDPRLFFDLKWGRWSRAAGVTEEAKSGELIAESSNKMPLKRKKRATGFGSGRTSRNRLPAGPWTGSRWYC